MRQVANITHFFFLMLFISLPISKGATSVVVVALMLLSLWQLKKKRPIVSRQDWPLLYPIAVFLFLALSLYYSSDLKRGINLLYRQNTFLFFPIIFLMHKDFLIARIQSYLEAFSYSILFVSCLTLLFFFLPEASTISITNTFSFLKDYLPQHNRNAFGAYSPFLDRLQFGYLIGIGILIQLWLLFQTKQQWKHLFTAFLLTCTLLILGARGAQLAFLVALAVWLAFIYRQYGHPVIQQKLGKVASLIIVITSIVFILAAIPYYTYQHVPAFAERYNQLRWEIRVFQLDDLKSHDYVHFTSIRRILSWNNTWDLIQQYPIKGTGIGDYESGLKSIYNAQDLNFPVNSHHQFLYYWASAGLLSLFAFLLSFFAFLHAAWNAIKWETQALNIAFWSFYCVIFMLDVPLIYQVGSTSFYTFFLFFLLMASSKKKS